MWSLLLCVPTAPHSMPSPRHNVYELAACADLLLLHETPAGGDRTRCSGVRTSTITTGDRICLCLRFQCDLRLCILFVVVIRLEKVDTMIMRRFVRQRRKSNAKPQREAHASRCIHPISLS